MRLTHLKLAGFKSFVDPTTLHLHGQRVGIVGPNGCGKSNVMEAIRWVLGESSARELRGDSMQDVIFNGSLNRKPVSRASVELHFDNSFGGPAGGGSGGQWSQYAEIVVKRVLERDGNSSYIINNQQVRRRDVTDLFLGTGVGSRAYAIIGQNTISRIVEAKPEEMRVFLEEAAGVSKYKERRRETELRLRDTRENLTRIDDIRRELDKQITQLEAQAEVAQRFHALRDQLDTTNQLIWLLKKRQAAAEWEKTRRRTEALVNELEAGMAALRNAESALEQTRLAHAEHSAGTQAAQAALYEANAVLSAAEQQLRHAQENVDRAAARERDLVAQQQRLDAQGEERAHQRAALEQQRGTAEQASITAAATLAACRNALPDHEARQRTAQQAMGSAQSALARAEQNLQVGLTNLQHQRRQLEQQQQRRSRLQAEQGQVTLPDQALIAGRESALQEAERHLAGLDAEIVGLQEQESAQQAASHEAQQGVQQQAARVAQVEAQFGALHKIQQALGGDARLGGWLQQHDLHRHGRLWQAVRADAGWETAVESVLGERLNALVMQTLAAVRGLPAPPAPLLLCAPAAANAAVLPPQGLEPLADRLHVVAGETAPIVQDWLAGIYCAASLEAALEERMRLRDGEWFACPQGHLVSRTGVRLHAPASQLHGVLERQRELDQLGLELPGCKQALAAAEAARSALAEALQETRRRLAEQRHMHKQAAGQQQALNLEVQKLRQQRLHAQERLAQFAAELADLGRQIEAGEGQVAATLADNAAQEAALADLKRQRDAQRETLSRVDRDLAQAREQLRQAEHAARESDFNRTSIDSKISELNNIIKVLDEQMAGLASAAEEARAQHASHDLAGLHAALEAAVDTRRLREEATAAARNALAGIEANLLETDRRRMQTEQGLHPLRDRLEQSRLAEQEARLHFEHCAEALAGIDEEALATQLEKSARPVEMTRRAEELQQEIAALGAVNLAAIEQLTSERERAGYLDAQALDLNSAIETLEEAIRRIDRESRSRLQMTFDEVNRNFAELFTVLFNGGQARLELLGEEILDTGIQVFAQPPGKKNSTIHLLSGGEKALTALALVFALFRLNPAPFCLMDEVDAPLDDSNTERFCAMVKKMSEFTQFVFISHNKIAMEMAQQLVGVTMQESGVSRVVEVDVEEALRMAELA